jgi:hypothetical protein
MNQNQLVRELDLLSRVSIVNGGLPCTEHDVHQFRTVTILRYGLECDLSGTSLECGCYRRAVLGQKSVDLQYYFSDMKFMKLSYINGQQGTPEDWSCFKRRISGHIHYKWMMSVVEKFFPSFKDCLQWLSFDERLLLDGGPDVSVELQKYRDFESQLKLYRYDEGILHSLSEIISDFLKDFSFGAYELEFKFGPGATSEISGRKPPVQKVKEVGDGRILSSLADSFNMNPEDIWPGPIGSGNMSNRIIFVPKNATSHRVISAEPTWLSWVQQGMKSALYSYTNTSKKMYTNYENQADTRIMALQGSLDGSYSTRDLSSASDSVTVQLVASVYRSTYIVDSLLAARSTHAILPDESTLQLEKYAPMGSALCFWTMDTLLLACCELAIRNVFHRYSNPSDYRVYGDDIIIRTEAVEELDRILTTIHFEINESKSYSCSCGAKYREACGIEAYNGQDVTPLRVSRFAEPLVGTKPDTISEVSSQVAFLNGCYQWGYTETRRIAWQLIRLSSRGAKINDFSLSFIWDHVLRIDYSDSRLSKFNLDWSVPNFRAKPLGKDGPMALVVPDGTASNFRCRMRRDRDLQVNTAKVVSPKVRPLRATDRDEESLLRLWFYYRGARTYQDGSLRLTCIGTSLPEMAMAWYEL